MREDARSRRLRTEEKKNAPVITATYKVQRSAELLEFLLARCKTSRNNVKSLLTNRQVLVNGSLVSQYNFLLAREDEVKITKSPVSGGQTKQPERKQRQVRLPFPILYEDDDFIAVDKPVGLLSVENGKERECAFAFVFAYLQSKDKSLRPYVLHRIDKETSGVLVFAKNPKVHSALRLHWNEFVKTREYYAVVEGMPEKKEDTLVSYLVENKNNVVYCTHDPSGQKAITHYAVVGSSAAYALLRVKIDTGRKNQIRVQMQAAGHPIVGDAKYGCAKDPLRRLGLHASALEFTHPFSGALLSFRSAVPACFRALFSAR